jgi:hypothetical protein
MLVERARLAAILKIARKRLHPVCELVGHHVERPREPLENLAVAIPIRHLAAIPESVVHRLVFPRAVRLPHVHARNERHATIVERITAKHLAVEIVGVAGKIVGLVHRHVG